MRDLIASIPLFKDLTDEELALLIGIGKEVAYPKGMTLFSEGDPGNALYVVLDGAVRISKVVPGAGEEAMAFMERGSYFGEMALLDDFPRSATAIAHSDCRVLFIEKGAFLDLLHRRKDMACKILWVLCRTLSARVRETSDRIVTLFTIAKRF